MSDDDVIENLIVFLSNIVDDLPSIRKKKTISNHSITLGVGHCTHGKLLTTSSAKIMKVKVPKKQIKKEILDKIISEKFGLEKDKTITKKQYWMIIKGILNKCDARQKIILNEPTHKSTKEDFIKWLVKHIL